MIRCAGCEREADRSLKHNDSLFICTPCTKILPGIQSKELEGLPPNYCPECDERLWHGQVVCGTCVDELLVGIVEAGISDILENNPFIDELLRPATRFYQGCTTPGERCVRSEFWYDFRVNETYHTISFAALREAEGMMIRIPDPRCDCCDSTLHVDESTNFPGLKFCDWCRKKVCLWLVTHDLADSNPFAEELLASDAAGSTYEFKYPLDLSTWDMGIATIKRVPTNVENSS